MSFIKNVQTTFVFETLKSVLDWLEKAALFTSTPFDNIAVAVFKAVLEAFAESKTNDEVLKAVAEALPDDEEAAA